MDEAGPVHRITVITDQMIELGENWTVIRFVHWLSSTASSIHTGFSRGARLKCLYIGYCGALCASMAMGATALSIGDYERNTLMLYAIIGELLFSAIGLACTCYVLCRVFSHAPISNDFVACALLFTQMQLLFGILTCVELADNQPLVGALLMVFVYLSRALEDTIVVFMAALTPLIAVALFFEMACRLVKCDTACPKQEPLLKNYECQPYHYKAGNCAAEECIICLSKFADRDSVLILRCHESHVFHESCLIEWMKKHYVCPICRKDVDFVTVPHSLISK